MSARRGHGLACRMPLLIGASLLLASCAHAAEPVPRNQRIDAQIVRTMQVPPPQAMHMPTDVAVDSKGRVFVADGANDRIIRFDAAGKFEEAITTFGNQELKRPVGLTIDTADQLWIADTGNGRALLVSADGEQATPVVPIRLEENPQFDLTDIAVARDGKRAYLVDNNNHRILVRDNQTKRWTSMGVSGRSLGEFQWPFMVCVGAEDYVYVTEAIGARVQQISPGGRWAGEIGRFGVELGRFYRPKGIAADAHGRIYVSDSTMGVVQVFSARGAVEGVLTDDMGQPLRFKHPMGMCFDRSGQLYVVEMTANRVAVVSLAKKK